MSFYHLLNICVCLFPDSQLYQIYFWYQAPELFLTWLIEWQMVLSAKIMCQPMRQ